MTYVTFNGTRFRVEQVNPNYTRWVPDNPTWLLDTLNKLEPKELPKNLK